MSYWDMLLQKLALDWALFIRPETALIMFALGIIGAVAMYVASRRP